MPCKESILLFGPTGSGKTVQFGELALAGFMQTGGAMDEHGKLVGGQTSRLYSVDQGGWTSIDHLIDLGIVEAVDMRPYIAKSLWSSWDAASKGYLPVSEDGTKWGGPSADGKFLMGYEGASSVGDLLLKDMREGNANGSRVIKGRGQDTSIYQDDFTFAPTNETMYGYAQARILDLIQQSQSIAGAYRYTYWSALAYRSTDQDDNSIILGPQSAGKKLASELPSKFTFTFRLQDLAADPMFGRDKPEYRLYMDAYKDDNSPGVAKVVGNSRIPLSVLESVLPEGGFISPASLVRALDIVHSAGDEAKKAVSALLRQAYRKGGVKEALR